MEVGENVTSIKVGDRVALEVSLTQRIGLTRRLYTDTLI